MESSRISICIPTYNRCDLLKKTLMSVSRQTVRPYEVIVVDNCSGDDTEAVAKSFGAVTFYKNDHNLGLAGNWNQCIKLAKGEFLTILHSDDLIAPSWYEEMQNVIKKYLNTNAGAFFLPVFTIDINENAKIVYYSLPHSTLLENGESIKILWRRNMCGLPASGGIIFRRSIFTKIGMFNESYTTETDTLTVLRILNSYPIYYYKKLLYAYRIHPFQTFDKEKATKSFDKKFNVLRNHLEILKNFYNNELMAEYKQDLFYKRVVYMYMAIAIFYFLIFKMKLAKRYYENIKQSLPGLVFTITDHFRILSVVMHYVYALILGRVLAFPIKSIAKDWVKTDDNYSSSRILVKI